MMLNNVVQPYVYNHCMRCPVLEKINIQFCLFYSSEPLLQQCLIKRKHSF